MIDLRFDSAAPTRKTAVLFLTYKTLVNRQSDFLALGFMIVTEGPGDILLLSLNLSVVETIYASRIALY